jgi:hypothetical protein
MIDGHVWIWMANWGDERISRETDAYSIREIGVSLKRWLAK